MVKATSKDVWTMVDTVRNPELITDRWEPDDRVKDCTTCYFKDARGDEWPCNKCTHVQD